LKKKKNKEEESKIEEIMHPRSAMDSVDGSQGDSICVDCGVGFHLPRGSVGNTTHGSRILVPPIQDLTMEVSETGPRTRAGQPWLVSTSMDHMRFTQSSQIGELINIAKVKD
jgi:hypothetical protein